ncbi:MAG: TlpA disulfide reductase family protein [Planctomycetota bacterium]
MTPSPMNAPLPSRSLLADAFRNAFALSILVLVSLPAASQETAAEPALPAEPAEQIEPAEPSERIPARLWEEGDPGAAGSNDLVTVPGLYRAWLELPSGHELGFNLEIDFRRDAQRRPIYPIAVINGIDASPAVLEPQGPEGEARTGLVIGFADTDARIEAEIQQGGQMISGEMIYSRDANGEPVEYRLPFRAAYGDFRRYDTPEPEGPEDPPTLATDWRVTFESRQGPAAMSVRLLPDGRHVQGTISTPTGDDGVLVGTFYDGRLRLSRFTGASGLLYDATLQPDGSLAGTFHSLGHHTETFTASPARDAVLPDLFTQTRWLEGVTPADLAFRDTAGSMTRLGELAPGPALLYVFGTWCHNCSDATRYLNELHERHADALPIVGIAFESPADFETQAAKVRSYAQAKGVRFPMLIAGERDKSAATETLGALDRVRAYPTFVFIDREGEPVAVHQGFIGPADPGRHAALRAGFDRRINAILGGG